MRWLTLVVLLIANSIAQAQFVPPYIADYQVAMDLHRDNTLTVTETIVVNFGQVQRHGIYRKVPYRYERKVGGIPTRYNLRIKLLSVTDAQGNPWRVKTSRYRGYVEWRIGDPNIYVSGLQTYRITYHVARAINYFDHHDELYWNVTGNEWEWDIARARCVLTLPDGVDTGKVRYTFYTGYLGSQEQKGRAWLEGNRAGFETGLLRQGEGLTVVVGVPKGVLKPPSTAQQAAWFLSDNWGFIVAPLLPLLTLAVLFWRYWRYGRDPIWREAIVAQYRPPDNLTPAEVGVVLDEKADNIDIVATVIDLAVKGYLKIREVETTSFLFFKSNDYELVFLRDADDAFKNHEQVIWNGLRLGIGEACSSVRLSELRERFHTYLENPKTSLYHTLTKNGYFAGNPETVRGSYFGGGLALLFVGVFASVMLTGFLQSPMGLALGLGVLLVGLAFMAFARAMPSKTLKGAKALWHIIGFREFIRRVERDRLERMLREDPTLFDRVLPYALVFGVADQWAEKFDGLLQKPPDWYESPSWMPTTFSSRAFIHSLGDSITTMNSVLPSSPRSSGAGGGSSGFGGGGGGFSGGGFGGGGGGGW